jgi:Predicted xylanase/chitin deacetylase
MAFPGNKTKAFTFSYDDGVEQDRRLVEIFNRYNLKCTFNLNSGIQSGASRWQAGDAPVRRMNAQGLQELYKGHEIAVHGLTHPRLELQDIDTIQNEIVQDKRNLQRLFDCEIKGMAYPYGTYDDRVLSVLKDSEIQYARTTVCTESFDVQDNLLEFKPTCHHNNERLMDLAEEFISLRPSEPKIFYVWGHSYEFDQYNNWEIIERFCAAVSGRDDIFYGTNSEVLL